jgi:hypothetical protein
MEPLRPKLRLEKKRPVKIKLPVITRSKSKSLFEEYYYPLLLIFSCGIILLLKAGGMSFYDAAVAGLWLGAIVFFVTQVIRYFQFRANPPGEARSVPLLAPAEKKPVQAPAPQAQKAQQMKPKLVPAKARPIVKDTGAIKLVPKPGQQPRPPIITGTAPPSPFIKPPK